MMKQKTIIIQYLKTPNIYHTHPRLFQKKYHKNLLKKSFKNEESIEN